MQKNIITIHILIALLVFMYGLIESGNHVFNYSETIGLGKTALGYPKVYNAVIFDFIFWLVGVFTVIGLVYRIKIAWAIFYSYLIIGLGTSIFVQLAGISIYIGNFSYWLLLLSFCCVWYGFYFAQKEIKKLFFQADYPLKREAFKILFIVVLIGIAWFFTYF